MSHSEWLQPLCMQLWIHFSHPVKFLLPLEMPGFSKSTCKEIKLYMQAIFFCGHSFAVNKLKWIPLNHSHRSVFTAESRRCRSERTMPEQDDTLMCFHFVAFFTFLMKADIFLCAVRLSHLFMCLCVFSCRDPLTHTACGKERHISEKNELNPLLN